MKTVPYVILVHPSPQARIVVRKIWWSYLFWFTKFCKFPSARAHPAFLGRLTFLDQSYILIFWNSNFIWIIFPSPAGFSIRSVYELYALDIVRLREIPPDSFYWSDTYLVPTWLIIKHFHIAFMTNSGLRYYASHDLQTIKRGFENQPIQRDDSTKIVKYDIWTKCSQWCGILLVVIVWTSLRFGICPRLPPSIPHIWVKAQKIHWPSGWCRQLMADPAMIIGQI